MFYFIPIVAFPWQNIQFDQQMQLQCQSIHQLEVPSRFQAQYFNESKQISKDYWGSYLKIFQQQLTILYAKQKKKVWSQDEDELLFNLNKNRTDWKSISSMFEGTNPEICKRRYYRIVEKFLKWPKDIDDQIKYMREVKMRKWSYIAKTIELKFRNFRYTGKMIKERYEFYLRGGIELKQWTMEQDIKLLEQVRMRGRYWKNIMQSFPGRTELQLKNRYNGTLKLIERRVLSKLREQIEERIENN